MKTSNACLLLLIAFATWPAFGTEAETTGLEVWLASGPKCNSCDIFQEIDARRGYGDEFTYEHRGRVLTIPIKRVKKDALPQELLDRLTGDAGPASPYWPIQLSVLVLRHGEVLYFASIGESADLRAVTLPDERMKPPAHPPTDHPSLNGSFDYRSLFLREWTLEYFVAVALGDRKSNANRRFVDLHAAQTPTLGPVNVVLWGAGGIPIKNPLFISHRLQQARSVLEHSLNGRDPRFITLYGRGPDGDSNDTSILRKGAVSFMHPDMSIDYAADAPGLSSVFSALRSIRGRNTLLIHAGHSGPTGIPIWGSLGTVTPEDITAIGDGERSQLKIVSGGCHSGLFARAAQCGFFAAHPDVVATGCQLSPEAIEKSDDYLRFFFRYLDENGQGDARLDSAHWAASVRLEHHQLSYSTVDALADEYFRASAEALPSQMKVADIRQLRAAATAPEAQALDALLAGLESSTPIALDDLVKRNHAAEKVLRGATEDSSARRNRKLALPYRLMLPSLARRLVYRSARATDPELKRVTECEAGSLATL
jgi:hypothetical protein